MILQKKVSVTGVTREWPVDLTLIRNVVGWANRDGNRLERELEALSSSVFDEFLLVFPDHEQTDLRICSKCGDVVVPWDGKPRCANCGDTSDIRFQKDRIGFAGCVPIRVGEIDSEGNTSGRHFLVSAINRTLSLPDGDSRKSTFLGQFATVDDTVWFTPHVLCFLPDNWPRRSADVFLRQSYFDVLNIEPVGTYEDTATHHRVVEPVDDHQPLMVEFLRLTLLPRFSLDLMLADLSAVGLLDEALRALRSELEIDDSDAVLPSLYSLHDSEPRECFTRLFTELINSVQDGNGL